MLTLDKITKGFGPQTVLKDISLVVGNKERVGVVGVNGAGKSTLVKIMGKQLEPDKGVVDTHAASVGYLSQESQCRLGVTIGEEMRSVLPSVTDVEQRLEAHTLDARIGRVLSGLGFELDAVDRLTDTYSKGWQMRIVMAKLLVQEPDYLLLDEPTSHLDITARSWLMHEFIPSYPGTVIVISHEPEFLNVVCDRILEVEDQTVKEYMGNYDDYQRLKEEAYYRYHKEWEAQREEGILPPDDPFNLP